MTRPVFIPGDPVLFTQYARRTAALERRSVDTMPIATDSFFWSGAADPANPGVAFAGPCTLVSQFVDAAAASVNLHLLLFDVDDVDDIDTGATKRGGPGPARLGSNVMAPREYAVGLAYMLVDDAGGPVDPGDFEAVTFTLEWTPA